MSALPKRDFQALSVGLVPLSADPALAALDDATDSPQWERRDAALRDDLAAIAAKTGRRITIPDRPFTLEEWQTIRLLRSILRTARVHRTWTKLVFSMKPDVVRQIIEQHGDEYFALRGEQPAGESVDLFGVDLPLGWCRFSTEQARLTNIADIKVSLQTAWDSSTPIRLHFVPGLNATLVIDYPEWALNPMSVGESRRLDAAERIVLLDPEAGQRLDLLLDQQQYRSLDAAEQSELDALVAEHRQRLVAHGAALFVGRRLPDPADAQSLAVAQLAEAEDWWREFAADPARVEAAVALARRRRSHTDD